MQGIEKRVRKCHEDEEKDHEIPPDPSRHAEDDIDSNS
jgi:hypothetical protein